MEDDETRVEPAPCDCDKKPKRKRRTVTNDTEPVTVEDAAEDAEKPAQLRYVPPRHKRLCHCQ